MALIPDPRQAALLAKMTYLGTKAEVRCQDAALLLPAAVRAVPCLNAAYAAGLLFVCESRIFWLDRFSRLSRHESPR